MTNAALCAALNAGEDFGKYSIRLSAAAPAAQAMRAANYNKSHPLARYEYSKRDETTFITSYFELQRWLSDY